MPGPYLPDTAAAWQAAVARVLKGADAETLVSHSRDGIAIAPLYGQAAPTTSAWRGEVAPMGIIQRLDSPDPDDAAQLARLDAAGGATGLTLVMADAPSARGFGLSAEAAEAVLDVASGTGLMLRCELPAVAALPCLDRLVAACERRGLTLDVAADPLGIAAGTGAADPVGAADRWLETAGRRAPAAEAFRADGRPHHEAGASEAQELAAVLSTGVHYLRALERAGIDAGRIAFTLVADTDHLFTIAKLRASRRLWARVLDLCGIRPEPIALHAETSWRMLSGADPWTNLLRNTIACAGAILGGADTITVLPFTAARGLPDAFARRLARNAPLVLGQESGLGRVADPLAGSGAVEAMTAALCSEAWRLFQDLEREGGIAAALLAGTWQARVAAARQARADDLASGRTKIVGVTAFRPPADTPTQAVLRPAQPHRTPPAMSRFQPLPSVRDAEPFEANTEEGVLR